MGTNPTGTITGTITGTGTLTLTLIIIPSSLIVNSAAAWWKHTPQSLRDSSPNLGGAICLFENLIAHRFV